MLAKLGGQSPSGEGGEEGGMVEAGDGPLTGGLAK